jgi:hypothetical protein
MTTRTQHFNDTQPRTGKVIVSATPLADGRTMARLSEYGPFFELLAGPIYNGWVNGRAVKLQSGLWSGWICTEEVSYAFI